MSGIVTQSSTENMPNESILLVDDDLELTALMSQYLSSVGFEVAVENTGENIEKSIAELKPDLIVLDLMLPGTDGLTICKNIRHSFQGPILMLTALSDDIDEVTGLEVGADDYLTKPVKPRVLLAHIRAQLRRYVRHQDEEDEDFVTIRDGEIRISHSKRQVIKDGRVLDLTSAEFDLLWILARHKGQIVTREVLYQDIYHLEFDGLDRSIDLRISRLRKKLGLSNNDLPYIITVRSVGYQLAD